MSLYRLWVLTGVVVCLSVSMVYGEIYKWVDEAGKTHFSDEKPDENRPEQVTVQVNSIDAVSVSATDFLEAKERGQVVMYSAAWCGYCRKARNYFRQQGIPFKEYDIETSRKGRRDYAKLNGTGVPIILVGQKRMQGFRAERFQALYNQVKRDKSDQ